MTNNQNIDKLLAKFYDASISQEEIDILFDYFLYTDPLPECYSADVELIRGLAIMRYCHKTKSSFEKSLIEKERKARNGYIHKMVKYGVAFAACVAALVVGLWQVRTKSAFIPYAHEVVQPALTMLATQTTDMLTTPILQHTDSKPATITDNEIKNTADHTTNKYNHTRYAENEPATSQPDIIATAPIEQEHIPMLLAETETQIEIEQNLAAIDTAIDNINALHTDTILQLQKDLPKYETNYLAYIDDTNNTNLIPDISNTNTNEDLCSLNMITYCNIRCSRNNVTEKIINNLIII